MKNFAFRTRLFLPFPPTLARLFSEKNFYFCYAVVNLRLSPTTVGVLEMFGAWVHSFWPHPLWDCCAALPAFAAFSALSVTAVTIGSSHSCLTPCRVGGLKWTRTIDLTLIRRVL